MSGRGDVAAAIFGETNPPNVKKYRCSTMRAA